MTLVQSWLQKRYIRPSGVQKEVKKIMMRPWWVEKQIRPVIPPYLCFTANTASSTVKLSKNGSPTSVTLETSTDGSSWTTYSFGTQITLSNIWDKIYFRNTSETTTAFNTSVSNYYQFAMTWSIASSGEVNYLLNKNGTNSLNGNYTFFQLFLNCTSLTTPPELPATTLWNYCYQNMFYGCTSLNSLPKLPAIALVTNCYQRMFYGCSNIKLSTTQTWEYQNAYIIPSEWAWTISSWNDMYYMFQNTWWTFTWTPTINTTYYTSNTVV